MKKIKCVWFQYFVGFNSVISFNLNLLNIYSKTNYLKISILHIKSSNCMIKESQIPSSLGIFSKIKTKTCFNNILTKKYSSNVEMLF